MKNNNQRNSLDNDRSKFGTFCKKNFERIAKSLSCLNKPFFKEFPFICFFMTAMGFWTIIDDMFRRFRAEENFSAHPPYSMLFGRITILFLFAYLIATVITFIKNKHLKWTFKVFFYVIILSLAVTCFFLRINFDLEICPTCFVLLAETTGRESGEFIDQYILSPTVIPTLLVLLGSIIAIVLAEYFLRKEKIKNWIKVHTVFFRKYLSIVLLFVLVYGLCSTRIYWKVRNAETPDDVRLMYAPTDPISSIYTSLLTLHMMEENMKDAIEINKTVYEKEDAFITEDEPLNIVLVIGESYIKCHSQLYGYYLQTAPNMLREQQDGRLFVFNDVISTSNSTSIVVKNILSCNNSGAGEQWYDFPAFLTIFKKAGYNVYFWDNQRDFDSMATYSFTLNSFLYAPELLEIMYTKTNDEVYTYDGGLVESFNKTIDVASAKHNLILLHLQGQHLTPTSRFPQGEFERFTADSIRRNDTYLTHEMKEYIAGYDNATLYNDYVMDMVFDTFRDSNTIVIYFSDHGEEVYDYRKQCGRDHGEINSMTLRYQYEVPFMIWCSDTYMEKNPDVVNSIRQAVDRPFVNDNLSHMLFNLAGISTTYYREDFDLLSPNYRCEQREVKGHYIYEEMR